MTKKLLCGLKSFSDSTFSGSCVSGCEGEAVFFIAITSWVFGAKPSKFKELQTIDERKMKIIRMPMNDLMEFTDIIKIK
jgi:hypothetical protein